MRKKAVLKKKIIVLLYYTRNETKVAQPEFVDITGLMVNEH